MEAQALGAQVDNHQLIWYNVTDASTVFRGLSNGSTNNVKVPAFVSGRFTISGTKVFELRHRCQTTASNGFGGPNSFGTEIYADVKIWKVA